MKRGAFGWLAGMTVVALMAQDAAAAGTLSPDQAAVNARLREYDALVRAMDTTRLVGLFAPDAQLQHESQPPTRGRAAIEALYAGLAGYQVLENSTTPESTVVRGRTAVQKGRYHQKVKTPQGELVEVSGSFEADWLKSSAGTWLIERLFTQSN